MLTMPAHVPTYADIRDDLLAKFQEIYGNDLYLGNDSQDYQMISVRNQDLRHDTAAADRLQQPARRRLSAQGRRVS